MATDLFKLIDVAQQSFRHVTEVTDGMVCLAEKVSGGTATSQEMHNYVGCIAHALDLQKLIDDLRDELNQYLLLVDNDCARLGLTESKAEILRDIMEAAEIRPFAPLIKLYEELGKPPLLSPPMN